MLPKQEQKQNSQLTSGKENYWFHFAYGRCAMLDKWMQSKKLNILIWSVNREAKREKKDRIYFPRYSVQKGKQVDEVLVKATYLLTTTD